MQQPHAYASQLGKRVLPPVISDPSTTLEDALVAITEQRWRGRRCEETSAAQARRAIASIRELLKTPGAEGEEQTIRVADVTPARVKHLVQQWSREGLSASTINCRIGFLSAAGLDTTGCRVRVKRISQWWLNADAQEKLLTALYGSGLERDALLADYIVWAVNSGCRVEESLRIERRHFALEGGRVYLTVPGTKTAMAEATLPLNEKAAEVYMRRLHRSDNPSARLFPVAYKQLAANWREAAIVIGARGNRQATLKALRRSAARNLTVSGLPTAMLQFYLRHENIKTTEGYLRLTGGYHAAELARFV
jgi:integrase